MLDDTGSVTSHLAFTPKVVNHDEKGIKVHLEFDEPEKLGIGGSA